MKKRTHSLSSRELITFVIGVIIMLAGAFWYLTLIQRPSFSVASLKTIQALNSRYGFTSGESLLAINSRNDKPVILASLIQNNILADQGTTTYQGLVVKLEEEGGGSEIILLTPKRNITEAQLWNIAKEYEKSVPEIVYAEPDITLYSATSTKGSKAVSPTPVSPSSLKKSVALEKKWWTKKE